MIRSRSGASAWRISPLSVNDFPSYSPVQVIGLPTCQSVSTCEPNMKVEIASGSVQRTPHLVG